MIESYSYEDRKGIKPISWNDFYALCKGLVIEIAKYNPDIIVGIARGGLYPATQLSHMLQKELQTVRLSRRVNDEVVHKDPVWIQSPSGSFAGKKVLIVDEICDTGQTLDIVKERVQELGAVDAKTAVLYSHSQSSEKCDYVGTITNELLLNPWDREIYDGNGFVIHPEYDSALKAQGIEQVFNYMMDIEPLPLVKPH